MNVLFHADERPHSGRGHISRCRALARVFEGRGHTVAFAGAGEVINGRAGLIVVDSYAVRAADLSRWAKVAPLCVIDDLADRDLSSATAVLNQNFGAGALDYGSVPLPLLGPEFALLRPQFRRERRPRSFHAEDRAIVLTLGGGDVRSLCEAVVAALQACREGLEITVLGGREPYRENVAEVMAAADLAVCAGGVTALELCAVGTPAIIMTLAPNQEPGSAAMARAELAVLAGCFEEALSRIANDVDRLLADCTARSRQSQRMMAAVDGLGAERVATLLETIARP